MTHRAGLPPSIDALRKGLEDGIGFGTAYPVNAAHAARPVNSLRGPAVRPELIGKMKLSPRSTETRKL